MGSTVLCIVAPRAWTGHRAPGPGEPPDLPWFGQMDTPKITYGLTPLRVPAGKGTGILR